MMLVSKFLVIIVLVFTANGSILKPASTIGPTTSSGSTNVHVIASNDVIPMPVPLSVQYKREIRPLMARSITIAHKEIFFMALRVAIQGSFTVFNPNNIILAAFTNAAKFMLDICFQFVSFLHYREAINNEYGTPRVINNNPTPKLGGFIIIRALQRLAFLGSFYGLYSLLVLCTKVVAEYTIAFPGADGILDRFGYEVSNPVLLTFGLSMLGIVLFKRMWTIAVKLTIADKSFLWGLGGRDQGSKTVTVRDAISGSAKLVDQLNATGLISRLLVLYIIPRVVVSTLTRHGGGSLLFNAYIDIIFMIGSHLLFLDRMKPVAIAKAAKA